MLTALAVDEHVVVAHELARLGARGARSPGGSTTLSRRRSSRLSIFSPVTPFWRSASSK